MSVSVPINQEQDNLLTLRVQTIADVRALAQHYFLPVQPADLKSLEGVEYPRKQAEAALAVELVCSLVNMFGVMAGLKNYSGESAIADLTFALNTNPFWIKNAAFLMPILSIAVNAFQDNTRLKASPSPLWEKLQYHNASVWLEILPAVLFCLKGAPAMREKSLEMKQAFDKYLRANYG
jgi:hypothetical protein